MMETACFFTGHRTAPDNCSINKRVTDAVLTMYERGVAHFLCGGALGFDTIAARTVLKCRETRPDIKLTIVVPCREQDKFWTAAQKEIYRHQLDAADEKIYIADQYYRGCMQMRNRFLADNAKYGVAYLTKQSGGTYYTVNYALSVGRTMINVALPASTS